MFNWNDVSKLPGILFSRFLFSFYHWSSPLLDPTTVFAETKILELLPDGYELMEFHVENDLLIIACMSGEFRCR